MSLLIVSIDGPDLCGKTTVANLTLELLREKNKNITFKRTELPSNTVVGYFTDILRNSSDDVSSEVFALCYALDHLHHYQRVIEPMKAAKGNFVIVQERSLLTSFIYQGIIGNVDFDWLKEINKFDKNISDLSLILKVDMKELLKRKSIENKSFDKFEVEEFLEKQTKTYYNLPADLVKQFNVEYIDANEEPFSVAKKCAERIQKEIDKKF
jgi:thymidylate kinase